MKDGWITVKLGELVDRKIVELKRGRFIPKTELSDDYEYPVYSASAQNNGLLGYCDTYDLDEELISWSVDGGGKPFYREKHKFSVTNVCGYLRILQPAILDYKYLYYCMRTEWQKNKFDYSHKAHPSVIRELYDIVIPPMDEQLKIAQILSDLDGLSSVHLYKAQVISKVKSELLSTRSDIIERERKVSEEAKLLESKIIDITSRLPQNIKELVNSSNTLTGIHKIIDLITYIEEGGNSNYERERERAELLPEIVWKTAKLGELCQLKSGGTPKASVERYYTGDIPFLSIRDMTNCGKHIKDTQKHITQEAVDSCSTWIAPAGSLMYSICASVGNVSFIDVPMAMNQAIVSLTDMKIDSEYLYYYLLSLKGTNYINSKIINGAQPNINGIILRNYEIRYPESLEHQRYVAQILSDLDELSKLHSYKAGILSRVKTQLMNQKSGIIETERQKSDIPLGWMRVKIKDCLDYEQPTKYIVKSTDYRDDYSIPVLTANKTFILGYTDEEFGIYSKGDVIIYDDFTCDSKYVTFPFKVKSGAIKLLTPKQGIDLKFMWYILQTIEVDTSAHKRYYISEVAEQEILIPKELSEQQRIAKLLSTYDETLLSQLNLQEIAEREQLQRELLM